MRGSGFVGLCRDDRLPFLMADDHMAGAQLFDIVVRAADGDFPGMVEAMAKRGIARPHILHRDIDQFFTQDRDDPLEGPDPAQAFGRLAGRAPAHRLGPGEGADDGGDSFGQHIGGRAAGLVHHGEPHAVAIFQLVLAKAGLAQEAFQRLRRGAGARAFELFADGRRFQRQVARDQR